MNEYKHMLGKEFEITIDRPLGSAHPKFPDHIYPINYGYIEGIKAGDGDDIDVFVLEPDKPVESIKATIIAIIHRTDDNEDKLVASAGNNRYSEKEIEEAVHFQEKYFNHDLIL